MTCARQDGCVIAHREVCLGWMGKVPQTSRASAIVTQGSAWRASSRAESLNLYLRRDPVQSRKQWCRLGPAVPAIWWKLQAKHDD
jgi:hypothetical protein